MVKKIGSSGGGSEAPPENKTTTTPAGTAPSDTAPSPVIEGSPETREDRPDTGGVKEGGFLKALGTGMKVLNKLSVGVVPGSPGPTRTSSSPLKAKARALLSIVRDHSHPHFSALTYTGIKYGRVIEAFNARERIAVLKKLLRENPDLSIHDRVFEGSTLAHAVLENPTLGGEEQAALIYFLADQGVDFNHCDSAGKTPLDLAIDHSQDVIEPLVVRALKEGGAKFALEERIPIIGHLIGASGHVVLEGPNGPEKIRMEGLTPIYAEFGLDPVFKDAIAQVQAESSEPIGQVLGATLKAWDENWKIRPLIRQIDEYGAFGERRNVPVMVTTGWVLPAGHAVGLVGNEEAEGYYLYACNTGLSADPKRCIVRYEVTDPETAASFFRSCNSKRDEIRTLFTEGHKDKGLTRSNREDQMPREMAKAVQKRDNCPLTARKACLLALMWSLGRENKIPPQELRQAYKKITTLMRAHGVREALEVGHPKLMGKALINMLTKADRPTCVRLAWELTLALKKYYEPDEEGVLPEEPPPVTSELFIHSVGEVLKLTGLSPNRIYTTGGRTLAEHARRRGNPVAADLLEHYSKPMDGAKRFFRSRYWRSLLS